MYHPFQPMMPPSGPGRCSRVFQILSNTYGAYVGRCSTMYTLLGVQAWEVNRPHLPTCPSQRTAYPTQPAVTPSFLQSLRRLPRVTHPPHPLPHSHPTLQPLLHPRPTPRPEVHLIRALSLKIILVTFQCNLPRHPLLPQTPIIRTAPRHLHCSPASISLNLHFLPGLVQLSLGLCHRITIQS